MPPNKPVLGEWQDMFSGTLRTFPRVDLLRNVNPRMNAPPRALDVSVDGIANVVARWGQTFPQPQPQQQCGTGVGLPQPDDAEAIWAAGDLTVTWDWDAPAGFDPAGASFEIFRTQDGDDVPVLAGLVDASDPMTFDDPAQLTPGTTYLYQVRIVDADGNGSDFDDADPVTIPIDAPDQLQATWSEKDGGVLLTWAPVTGALGYEVRRTDAPRPWTTAQRRYVDTAAPRQVELTYEVRAVGRNAVSTTSAIAVPSLYGQSARPASTQRPVPSHQFQGPVIARRPTGGARPPDPLQIEHYEFLLSFTRSIYESQTPGELHRNIEAAGAHKAAVNPIVKAKVDAAAAIARQVQVDITPEHRQQMVSAIQQTVNQTQKR